jgi:isocitrate dehydrogenase
MSHTPKITYTKTDEAPALATASFLPIIRRFVAEAGIEIELRDISLAQRVLAAFPESLTEDQRVEDDLKYLSEYVHQPDANIIKLPNISASVPQLKATIAELQQAGYPIPDYPDSPGTDEELIIKERYNKIKGSAVNPVLREGNSDRRTADAVKAYAKHHPHSMGEWSSDSKTKVAAMTSGDFYETEQSVVIAREDELSIVHIHNDGEEVLKSGIKVEEGEVVDTAVMRMQELDAFIHESMHEAAKHGLLLSAHLKATMMKVSDPIIFGHIVSSYFEEVFERYAETFERLGVNPNNGLRSILQALDQIDESNAQAILEDINQTIDKGPDIAMVDSDKGITNFHVPSDVIIDASMPAMIRNSGKMWDKHGNPRDTLAMIPDRSYAGIYDEVIAFCKQRGAFDPSTMGSVANVGLMAQKAEEYGSHDKTFEMSKKGKVVVKTKSGETLMTQAVEKGDIFRMCQVKDTAIKDWVSLAIQRARITKDPAIFWLDGQRAHDRAITQKVETYLKTHDLAGLDIKILDTRAAMKLTLERTKAGQNTISVTGNVLRDYITDLFPILELGTSAKMLSVVPLMEGGGLFETGAGGSAPKHVQQLLEENHLRWDSLGEFLALGVSLEHLARHFKNETAKILASSLSVAVGEWLENSKSPSRKVGELDNRGSHFFLARYWAKHLAEQAKGSELGDHAQHLSDALEANAETIERELLEVQGSPVDIGGYYYPDPSKAIKVMRPSETLNRIID